MRIITISHMRYQLKWIKESNTEFHIQNFFYIQYTLSPKWELYFKIYVCFGQNITSCYINTEFLTKLCFIVKFNVDDSPNVIYELKLTTMNSFYRKFAFAICSNNFKFSWEDCCYTLCFKETHNSLWITKSNFAENSLLV
jgi:hypothetical protein